MSQLLCYYVLLRYTSYCASQTLVSGEFGLTEPKFTLGILELNIFQSTEVLG